LFRYYLVDDTIAIFEKAEANSGFGAGKFLERGPQKNADGAPVLATQLYVGAVVTLRSFQFRIVGADDFALNFMEENGFACSNAEGILARLSGKHTRAQVLPVFGSGPLPQGDFDRRLQSFFGSQLSEHECITLVRYFSISTPAGVEVAVNEFVEYFPAR
jgi:hypothetical protein